MNDFSTLCRDVWDHCLNSDSLESQVANRAVNDKDLCKNWRVSVKVAAEYFTNDLGGVVRSYLQKPFTSDRPTNGTTADHLKAVLTLAGAEEYLRNEGSPESLVLLPAVIGHLYVAVCRLAAGPEFGKTKEYAQVAWHARRLRDRWVDLLDRWEDHDALLLRPDAEIDSVIRLTILSENSGLHNLHAEGEQQVGREKPGGGGSVAIIERMLRVLYLPRYMLLDTVRTLWQLQAEPYTNSNAACYVRRTALIVAAICIYIAPLGVLLSLSGVESIKNLAMLRSAGSSSVIGFIALLFASAVGNASLSYPFLLRIQAATGLGMFALFSFTTGWVSNPPCSLAVLSTGGALAYLFLEARNQGVPACAAFRRALALTTLSIFSAIGLASLLLGFGHPLFIGSSGDIASGHNALRTVTVVSTTGFAIGIFIQILWEDLPITAPLAHRSRSRALGAKDI